MTDTSNPILAKKKSKGQVPRLILAPQEALGECDPQNLDKSTFFMLTLASFPVTRVRVRNSHCNVPPRIYCVVLIFEILYMCLCECIYHLLNVFLHVWCVCVHDNGCAHAQMCHSSHAEIKRTFRRKSSLLALCGIWRSNSNSGHQA